MVVVISLIQLAVGQRRIGRREESMNVAFGAGGAVG